MNQHINRAGIINHAVNLKRRGDLDGALRVYRLIIPLFPDEVMIYYGMAKVFYLKGDRDESVRHYLISEHLHLLNVRRFNPFYSPEQVTVVPAFPVPHSLFAKLNAKHPLARFVLSNVLSDGNTPPGGNTPWHLGHALLDLGGQASDKKYIREYAKTIAGQSGNISRAKEKKYFIAGVEFLLENLRWDQLDSCPRTSVPLLYGYTQDDLRPTNSGGNVLADE